MLALQGDSWGADHNQRLDLHNMDRVFSTCQQYNPWVSDTHTLSQLEANVQQIDTKSKAVQLNEI